MQQRSGLEVRALTVVRTLSKPRLASALRSRLRALAVVKHSIAAPRKHIGDTEDRGGGC
jgi:hypothetical protein